MVGDKQRTIVGLKPCTMAGLHACCTRVAFGAEDSAAHVSTTRLFCACFDALGMAGVGFMLPCISCGPSRSLLAGITRSACFCLSEHAMIGYVDPESTAVVWKMVFNRLLHVS